MKKVYYIFLLLFLFSCNDKKNNISEKLIKNADGKIYIALVKNCFNHKSFDLTNGEVELVDKILIKTVEDLETEYAEMYSTAKGKKLEIDLRNYKRQYCAFYNSKGEKLVYINCFCNEEHKGNWYKNFFSVYGGGICYFSGEINLNTKKSNHFMINAPE